MIKIILDLCGGTGAWSKPYKDNGYEVINVTLPDYDVTEWQKYPEIDIPVKENEIYGILAAPPCTMFSIARNDKTAREPRQLWKGLYVVNACLAIIQACQEVKFRRGEGLKFWAMENPASGYLNRFMGKPTFVFHPYEFGDAYTKKTALWGMFNKPIKNPVIPEKHGNSEGTFVKEIEHFRHMKDFQIPDGYQKKTGLTWRTIARSITPRGFAEAFFRANN